MRGPPLVCGPVLLSAQSWCLCGGQPEPVLLSQALSHTDTPTASRPASQPFRGARCVPGSALGERGVRLGETRPLPSWGEGWESSLDAWLQ